MKNAHDNKRENRRCHARGHGVCFVRFNTTTRAFMPLTLAATLAAGQIHAADAPVSWIDPDTGHRIIRLSTQPGSASLYFHQNAFTPKGDRLVFDTPDGIVALDLAVLNSNPPTIQPVLVAPGFKVLAAARSAPEVYFTRARTVWAADIYTHATRQILPARAAAINCDGTIAVQVINAADPTGKVRAPPTRTYLPERERMFGDKLKANIPLTPEEEASAQKEDGLIRRLENQGCEAFVFTDLKTGQSVTNGYQFAWLNHLQFSPTDPHLLLYCHEGSWHEVDRIWTIRTDGSKQKLMHQRKMDMEIAGHEFWSADGRTIWFDLQTPRSQEFWLAGLSLDTGKETHYHLDRDWWSIHYNVSRDGKIFCGDGADPGQVSFAQNAQWINLFRPQPDGTFSREKLVNMSKHNYQRLEPNVCFTPDGKWVVFRSNMFGSTHVFAVEVAKAQTAVPR
jgi:oligogalacturonide lyase